ncbi:hypothetical protein AB5N19_14111 [Seiridium cardinale]
MQDDFDQARPITANTQLPMDVTATSIQTLLTAENLNGLESYSTSSEHPALPSTTMRRGENTRPEYGFWIIHDIKISLHDTPDPSGSMRKPGPAMLPCAPPLLETFYAKS